MGEDDSSGLFPPPDDLGYREARDIGRALADAGDTGGAIPYFARAVSLRQDSRDLVGLGGACRDQGRLDDALSVYQEAIALEPPGRIDAAARIGASAVLNDKGDPIALTNALDLIGSVLAVEPKNVAAHWTAYSICKNLSRRAGYESAAQLADAHKAKAELHDHRTRDERRDERRRRAVRAQRSVSLRRASAQFAQAEDSRRSSSSAWSGRIGSALRRMAQALRSRLAAG